MTEKHTDDHPAELDHVEAQAGQSSTKFRTMLIASTILVIVAMVVIFLVAAV